MSGRHGLLGVAGGVRARMPRPRHASRIHDRADAHERVQSCGPVAGAARRKGLGMLMSVADAMTQVRSGRPSSTRSPPEGWSCR